MKPPLAPAPSPPFALSLLLALSLALQGCSGGGGGSPSGGGGATGSAALSISPESHPDLLSLDASFESVELLDAQGNSTGNLLAASVSVRVVSESADPVVVALRSPAAGRYDRVRVRFAASGHAGRDRNGGATEIEVERHELEDRFAAEIEHGPGGHTWIHVRHRTGVACTKDAIRNAWHWTPDLDAERGAGSSLHGSSVRVTDVHADSATFGAVLDDGCGRVTATFHVAESAKLFRDDDGSPLARAEFFQELAPGAFVRVQGDLTSSGTVEVRQLTLRQGGGSEDEVEVLAVITMLDRGQLLADLDVLATRRGSALVERFLNGRASRKIPVSLAGARIGRSAGGGLLSLNDLTVGQRVEAEFEHFPLPLPMRVQSIQLEDVGAEVEGYVGDTQGMPVSFVLHPRPDDSLHRSGTLENNVRIALSPATLIYLEREENRVGPERITVDAKVRVKGTIVSSTSMDAASVRIREEHGGGK